jgi:hypothetical protein
VHAGADAPAGRPEHQAAGRRRAFTTGRTGAGGAGHRAYHQRVSHSLDPDGLRSRLAAAPELTVLRRDTLFTMEAGFYPTEAAYDVAPGCARVVFARPPSRVASPVLVFGCGDEVRAPRRGRKGVGAR